MRRNAELERVLAKYPPNIWIKLAYKYVSGKLSKIVFITMLIIFLTGFIFTIAGISKTVISISAFSYTLILIILILFLTVGKIMNISRINKIIEELGITAHEYNSLIDKYYKDEIRR